MLKMGVLSFVELRNRGGRGKKHFYPLSVTQVMQLAKKGFFKDVIKSM
jgi:hypothetical protein